MTSRTVVHGARLIDDGTVTDDAWVAFADGVVADLGTGDGWRRLDGVETVSATALAGRDAVLSPGFVDLHVHGGAGAAHEDGVDGIVAARRLHRAHGTTSALVSFVSAPLPLVAERVAAVAELTGDAGLGILGSHLEGPFLDPAHRGAHDPRALVGRVDVESLLAAGAGTVRQVTLAPELPGALSAIGAIVAAGAVAAIGHTGADRALASAAFDAGATLLTHAFNAMPGLHHRAPGPVGAAFADPRVALELIADGVHLHPDLLRLAFAAAPGRIALVTDAMAAAGHGDGAFVLGGLPVRVERGAAHLADGTLAGSTLTQDAAVRIAEAAGVSRVEALRAVTATPARVLGAAGVGTLRVGSRADAVLLTDDLAVAGVWSAGARVPEG
jgi:N-acetylglucosamine-6-phosphate deacetylase